MRIKARNVVGLLMAPDQLPSCFSWEERPEDASRILVTPQRRTGPRLRDMPGAWKRAVAARRAESHNRSAAAW